MRQPARTIQERVWTMPFQHADGSPVTLSVGMVCRQPEQADDGAVLISRADGALYRVKPNGRDRIETA